MDLILIDFWSVTRAHQCKFDRLESYMLEGSGSYADCCDYHQIQNSSVGDIKGNFWRILLFELHFQASEFRAKDQL